jgi:hypothetical protein
MFKEIKNHNKKLHINKVNMLCDEKDPTIPAPLENYNFFSLIVGAPASGKSNLLINLITKKGLYRNKFDTVIIWSPSLHTLKNPLPLRDDHIYNGFNNEDLENEIKKIEDNEQAGHTLFIFDDVITGINKNMKSFLRIIYNRRHLGLSIFIITQKFNKLPLELRVACSSLYLFKPMKRELDDVYKDIVKSMDEKTFYLLCDFVFDKKYNFLYYKVNENEYYKNFNKVYIINK